MLEAVETIYQNGAFVPEKSFGFPEGARVKITIETTNDELNLSKDEEAKRLRGLINQMEERLTSINGWRTLREQIYRDELA